jgi:hypothetical protein
MKEENLEEKTQEKCCKDWFRDHKFHKHHSGGSCGPGAIYGLGVVGALFYFLQNAVGFVPILMGIGKAFFWPAFVVFKVLMMLKI